MKQLYDKDEFYTENGKALASEVDAAIAIIAALILFVLVGSLLVPLIH